MSDERPGIDWDAIVGPEADIKFAKTNLPALEYAVSLARERSLCVQAGANIGIFPLYLARYFERVHCYEPDPEAQDFFFENILGAAGIDFHAEGLADKFRTGFLYRTRRDGRPGHLGTHHVKLIDDRRALPVLLNTIDALRLPACGLIYLDIEGFELFALRGAVDTIARCRPVIGVEINKNLDALDIKPSAVIDWIAEQGYAPMKSIGSDWIFAPAEWT